MSAHSSRLFESFSTTSTLRSSTASWRSSFTCCTSGTGDAFMCCFRAGLCLFIAAELVMLFLPSGICWWILETGAWWSSNPSSVLHTSERRSPESSLSTSRWSHASKIKPPRILMIALLWQIKRLHCLLYDHSDPTQQNKDNRVLESLTENDWQIFRNAFIHLDTNQK